MRHRRLGFIGLGLMGAPMVRRLIAQGHEITVWNREEERYAEVPGAVRAADPAAVREQSDIVILCVLDGDAVEQVCFGQRGLVHGSGAGTLIDTSTINPDRTRLLATKLADDGGMNWVDAPMSGGPPLAAEGRLTMLVGGEPAHVAHVRPVLDDLAANVTHLGPLGAGQTAKIVNQAIVGASYILMAEVLALSKAAGLAFARLPAALAGGLADSQALQRVYAQQASADYDPPRGYARQLDKDLKNVADYAAACGLQLPMIEHAVRHYHDWAKDRPLADGASIALSYDTQGAAEWMRTA
jgi:3-hydroxyisobutyrate dehydrogenase